MSNSTTEAREKLFSDLVMLMARLRSEHGCPWDREQDHLSLRPCLLEETYEVLEAIDRNDITALRQELGDLLLQVVFHAQIEAEVGNFDIGDVINELHGKLVARHPHVFGDSSAETAEAVLHQWDELKRKERGNEREDALATAPKALPALARAQLVKKRMARRGLSPTREKALADGRAALSRLEAGASADEEDNIVTLLLAAVDLALFSGIEAEQALRQRIDSLVEDLRNLN